MSRSTQLPTFVSVRVLSLRLSSEFRAGVFAQVVKTTICHIPTKGNEDPKTLELPADVAQRYFSSIQGLHFRVARWRALSILPVFDFLPLNFSEELSDLPHRSCISRKSGVTP
jgi:hypothetical protein